MDVQTNLLEPGEQETLTLYPDKEGVYKYFDKRENSEESWKENNEVSFRHDEKTKECF
ncbi:MAG: hypothetical protein OES23_01910 [Nitrosopumilus sp.]|nr:hypothetical protein [Nitrosopumilus sp.]